jgi:hypothetical protein
MKIFFEVTDKRARRRDERVRYEKKKATNTFD